jgi:putative phosphoesterase
VIKVSGRWAPSRNDFIPGGGSRDVRLVVLSDPHANLPALEAVLRDARGRGDRLLCAGDLVGYHPWPNDVIEVLRANRVECIRGDHDRGVLGILDIGMFDDAGAHALEWTGERLTEESRAFLRSIEDRRRLRLGERLVAMHHGSPAEDDEAVFPEHLSPGLLHTARADLLLLGHTHVPMTARYPEGIVVNPGSVGQPRDGDPRASYAVVDLPSLAAEVRRVPYDVEAVVEQLARERLPAALGERLREGR